MKLTPEQFRAELRRMVASPAWAELPAWFTEVMVRRVLRSNDAIHAGQQAAGDVAGAAALMLAIENEVSTGETSNGKSYRSRVRAESTAAAQAQRGRGTNGARARGPGQSAEPGSTGGTG